MEETGDSVVETQRLPFVSVSGYITVFHVSVATFTIEPEHFLTMFLTDFGFRNRVFPQSLSCLYVTETWNFVTETCIFVPSSSGNVKIRSGSQYFSRSIYRQWRLIHYTRQTNIYRHKNPSFFLHLFPSPVHRILSNNAYDLWSYLIGRSCKVNIIVACLESIK